LAAAAEHLAFDAFERLLEHGADVNAGDGAVLHAALASLDETMVEVVLYAGPNLDSDANSLFRTLLDTQPRDLYGAETDFSNWGADLMVLLLRHGARPAGPDVIDVFGRSRDGKRIIETAT
jgi:hypothetical protein